MSTQVTNRLANYNVPQNLETGSVYNTIVEPFKLFSKALALERNDQFASFNVYENVAKLFDKLIEYSRKGHDHSQEIWRGLCSAITNIHCGKFKESNEQFKRCLDLSRCHRQELVAKVCSCYTAGLFMQFNLDEALRMSLEAETNFLALYRKAFSEDQKIALNQEKCVLGMFQTRIFVLKGDFVRALYASERYRMPALRKDIHLPLIDAENIINDFVSHLLSYCKENFSILVYFSELNSDVYCWVIRCDGIGKFGIHLEDGIISN